MRVKTSRFLVLASAFCLFAERSFAQGGTVGIDAATSSLNTYVDPLSTLILSIGAVVGLIGGIRVYIKWNSGDNDVNKELMSWGGSCLFLILVSVVIKAFFGV
ncbi:Conserved transmembrane protein found in conjugate transposon TraE [Sphingobacterium sp. PM2-P1-29]|nr:Conserved transmembrane protein found in conjugate transposon TraE [Sphingobacterium sp. PM2-P1-29]